MNKKEVYENPNKISCLEEFGTYKIELHTPLMDILDYQDLISFLETRSPKDTVIVQMETDGGCDKVGLQVLRALAACPAYKIARSYGGTSSFGTALLFGGEFNEFDLEPLATFIFHDVTYGMRDKHKGMLDFVNYMDKQNSRFIEDFYEGYLSENDLQSLRNMDELYKTGEEVVEMLKNKHNSDMLKYQESLECEKEYTLPSKEEFLNMKTKKDIINKLEELGLWEGDIED